MLDIQIQDKATDYQADFLERAVPERLIRGHDFYRRLMGWVVDNRTPLLYKQSHPDEYANFSINFNWLLERDYSDTTLGPPEIVKSLYGLHESTHMTAWLPTRLDEITAEEYGDRFTDSEYRASNETEILAHYRIPELRGIVMPGMKIAYDIMKQKGVEQPSSDRLGRLRRIIVEDTLLDGFFGENNADVLAFFKKFSGNRQWAAERFQAIRPYFMDKVLPLGSGLTDTQYEATIANYQPDLTQERYEHNIIRNVRLGHAMCGLSIPKLRSFVDARAAAQNLEGTHAVIQP